MLVVEQKQGLAGDEVTDLSVPGSQREDELWGPLRVLSFSEGGGESAMVSGLVAALRSMG
jgi:hypothetical protein